MADQCLHQGALNAAIAYILATTIAVAACG
jgi:hypothetical protein